MINDMWHTDADVELIARALWSDDIEIGALRDLTPQSYERTKPEYRRKALVALQALSGRTP